MTLFGAVVNGLAVIAAVIGFACVYKFLPVFKTDAEQPRLRLYGAET